MHDEKLAKARQLATDMICHPLANSDVGTVEYAGETLNELCAYCDRLRDEYELAQDALRLVRADQSYAHRLAVMLECALLDRRGTWDDGHALLGEYRAACAMPDEPQTFMGEPLLTPNDQVQP